MITIDDLRNLIVEFWFERNDREDRLRNYDMYLLSAEYITGGLY